MSTTLYTVAPVTRFSAQGYDIVQAGTVVPDGVVWAIQTAAAGAGVTLNTSAGGAPQLVQVPSYYNGGTGAPVGDSLPVGAEVKDSTGAIFEKTPGGWVSAGAQSGTSVPPLADVLAAATGNGALTAGSHNPVDASGGPRAMTLAAASKAGLLTTVEKTDSSTNAVTVTLNLRGTPGATLSLVWQNEALELLSKADGSWWPVAGHKTKTSLDAAYEPVGLATATKTALFAPLRPQVGGLVLGHIGDSIAGNGNDLTRWNTGLIGFITGQSILMQTCLLSGGRIVYGGSYGVAGIRVAAAMSQVASAKAAGCNAVLINVGTNNVEDGTITAAQTLADMQALIDSVAANGMLPVLSTLPPRGDRTGGNIGNTTNSDRFNAWLWRYATQKGYPLVDAYGALTAVTNGTYAAGMGADTLHPSHKGAKTIAQLVVAALNPLLPNVAPGLLDSSPATNAAMALRNPLFQTPTSGVPSQYGADAGLTSTCAADATVGLGNVWKIVRNTADGNGFANFAVSMTAGHKYLFGFKIRATVESGGGNWSMQFNAGTTYYLQLAAFATDLPSGSAFVGTFTAPATVSAGWQFTAATAGSVELAQLTLLDLTALGVP